MEKEKAAGMKCSAAARKKRGGGMKSEIQDAISYNGKAAAPGGSVLFPEESETQSR